MYPLHFPIVYAAYKMCKAGKGSLASTKFCAWIKQHQDCKVQVHYRLIFDLKKSVVFALRLFFFYAMTLVYFCR